MACVPWMYPPGVWPRRHLDLRRGHSQNIQRHVISLNLRQGSAATGSSADPLNRRQSVVRSVPPSAGLKILSVGGLSCLRLWLVCKLVCSMNQVGRPVDISPELQLRRHYVEWCGRGQPKDPGRARRAALRESGRKRERVSLRVSKTMERMGSVETRRRDGYS